VSLGQIQNESRFSKEFSIALILLFIRGKDLQKRLSDRTKELESDNRDRQREREEIEEMRLKVLTSGGVLPGTGVIPVITLDRVCSFIFLLYGLNPYQMKLAD